MSISFSPLKFWRILAAAVVITALNTCLRLYVPQLSPYYKGWRPAWVVAFRLADYFLFLATSIAAVGTIDSTLSQHTRPWQSIIGIGAGWLSYFVFFFLAHRYF